jgi:hypothetical protein
MDKNEEYIQTLNEKNRIKKMMRVKSEQEKVMEDRERGLSLSLATFSLSSSP